MAEAPTKTRDRKPDPLIGRTINERFRVLSLLARGGMGKVYRAEQAPLGRAVALKVLNPNYTGDKDPDFHKRFFLEASVSSKLTHPNTVTIFDYGCTDDDIYFIAMELLEGRTLHRALREDGPLSVERVLHIGRQICRSLREAHALGVIHRDLKPANIFLVHHGDEADFVKVLDFGLVKDLETPEELTQTGLFMGSPKYMSPEQIRGEDSDGRSDVYSLGVMLYKMLTGKPPFESTNSVNILMAHVHDDPPPMNETNPNVAIPRMVEGIVMRSLAKDPDARYASMDEFLVALKHASAEMGIGVSMSGESVLSGEFLTAATSSPTPTPSGVSITKTALEMSNPSIRVERIDTSPEVVLPPDSDPFAEDNKRKRARLLVGLALIAAALIGVYFALSDKSDEPIATPITTPTGPTLAVDEAEEVPEPRETEPAPERVLEVVLSSTPPGAMVRAFGTQYGPTPVTIEQRGDAAREGREVTFVFEREGHEDTRVTRTIEGESLTIAATLPEHAPDTPRVTQMTRSHMRTSMGMGMSTTMMRRLNGYKAEPY